MKPLQRPVLSAWMRWPVATLRTYLILVIVVATVPLGVLSSWLMGQEIIATRQQLSSGLQRAAGSLALMVEREQVSSLDALTVLSHSDELRSMDLSTFHRSLRRLVQIRPTWRRVLLMDPQGRVLLNSSNEKPFSVSDAIDPITAEIRPALPVRSAQVMGMTKSGAAGHWVTHAIVPVYVREQLRYVLVAEVDAQSWQDLISGPNAPKEGFVTIFDASQRVVARSAHPEGFVGQILPGDDREGLVSTTAGFHKTQPSEGGATYVAWQRIGLSGWGVSTSVPAAPLDADSMRVISTAVAAGLLSLLAGVGLALVVVRRVNEPLKALAQGGASAVPGDIAVREIGQLRDAMFIAEQQRQQARERLEAKAEEFETLFMTSPIGLSMTQDPSCQEVFRNPAKMTMFNMLPGQPHTFVLNENGQTLPEERHPLQRAAKGEVVWNQELEIRHDDGHVLKLLANAVPLLDGRGEPRGAISTFVDITERTSAQEHLMRAQTRLQDSQHMVDLAQEAGDVGFFDHVVSTGSVTMTAGLARLFGLGRQAAQMNWADWLQLVDAEDVKTLQDLLTQTWGDRLDQMSLKFRTQGDTPRWLSSRLLTLYDSSGKPLRMIGVMVDVTMQQQVEQERAHLIVQEQKARQDAENANRAKDEFLAMLGHELRNPLSAISAAIEVLNRISGQDEQAARVRMIITRQTRHLARLMDDLLDVARVIAGKINLSCQPVNLGMTVQRLVHTMKMAGLMREHPIEVVVDDVWINVDAMRLEQIVNNLVTNAVKYSPELSLIKVIVARTGQHARLQVIDQGMGIPGELMPRIFDLFVQGERSLDRRQAGLGIGLTLVKSLVELHEGQISVSSSNQGSTFTVDLPLIEPLPGADSGVPMVVAERREIVVVEDNPDAREALCFMLELRGHVVQAESDGRSGLNRILQVRPHLALVDIGLPELTGYEVARMAREQGYSGWLIAVSGYGQQQDVQSALDSGFDAHMVKPLDERMLESYLSKAPRIMADSASDRA